MLPLRVDDRRVSQPRGVELQEAADGAGEEGGHTPWELGGPQDLRPEAHLWEVPQDTV